MTIIDLVARRSNADTRGRQQPAKMSMRRPTRKPYRGRLTRLGKRADEAPVLNQGSFPPPALPGLHRHTKGAGSPAPARAERVLSAAFEIPQRAGGASAPHVRGRSWKSRERRSDARGPDPIHPVHEASTCSCITTCWAPPSLPAMQAAGCTKAGPVQHDHGPAVCAVAERELITPGQGRNQEHRVLEADAV
jgi:hypothetical protein